MKNRPMFRAAGIALVQPGSSDAATLLADLVAPHRLWVVSTDQPAPQVGRAILLPCDRGTLPAALLALVDVVVADPHAVVVVATPHAPAKAGDRLHDEIARAYLEAQLLRPVAIQDEATRSVALLLGRADSLMRAFSRACPRLARLFACAALMDDPERTQLLLKVFARLPTADLSIELVHAFRSGGERHLSHADPG